MLDKLRAYKYENALTVTELGEKLKCHRTYISSILTGKKQPGPALQYRMKKLLEGAMNKQIQKTCENKSHQQKVNPGIQDDTSTEIFVNMKPMPKLIPKLSHKSLHVQLQSKMKSDLCKGNK